MSADSKEEVKFSLRVVMNKEKTKVLFAEVDSDFADVLLSFLTLPLGTIVRLLMKHYGDDAPIIESLNSLYQGMSNLDVDRDFWPSEAKRMLLNPRNVLEPQCRKLKLNLDDTEPTGYFICENWSCVRDDTEVIVSRYEGAYKCVCGECELKKNVSLKSEEAKILQDDDGGVFTPAVASFLISDDLQMKPNLPGFSLEILRNLGISNADGLQKTTISFGFEEIMDLFKGSLISRTPLTDTILQKKPRVSNSTKRSERGASATSSNYGKRMSVRAIIQKSTKKVLLVQAEDDFVDFLFSLLRIPLGRVLCLLDTNDNSSGLDQGIYKLYRSVANLESGKHLKSEDIKSMLLKPPVPPESIPKNQIFPFSEEESPVLFCYSCKSSDSEPQGYTGYLTTKRHKTYGNEKYQPVYYIDLNRNEGSCPSDETSEAREVLENH